MSNELTIHFIRNYTAEPIGNAVEAAAQKIGLTAKASYGAFDNLGAELVALSSAEVIPTFVVVTIDLDFFAGGLYSAKWDFREVADSFNSILNAVDALPATTFVLISTFIPPARTSMPSMPRHPLFGRNSAAFELNALLRDFVAQRSNRCGILDFERVAAQLGEAATLDKRFGLMMKSPFKQEFVEAIASEFTRYLACRFLSPKKVLILDCDNTLWGGVVGESGIEGIQLDPYEYPGIAYYRVQSEILAIAEKGVLICLCSKNDEAAVWEVLDKHPHCQLRRDKIAGYRINWDDKATNITQLAAELNLAPDSMVFVDDNPAECELIKSEFPEVSIIQVPAKIHQYPGVLSASNLFDRISVNAEDKERARYYQAEQGRREFQTKQVDAKEFLNGLKMRAVIRPIEQGDLSRAAQLCQRTNQFNLTTKRYTEADLASLLSNPEVKIFMLQAEDRFGSLGHSGMAIFRKQGQAVEVDSFLMSCRIIGRLLDRALFSRSLEMLGSEWSFTDIRARYVPTQKNSVVAGLWKDYGFTRIRTGEGETYGCPTAELKVSFPDIIQLVERL